MILKIFSAVMALLLLLIGGCASPRDGAASNAAVTSPQGSYGDIAGDQRQATAAETGSASSSANPVIINAFAAASVKVGVKGDETSVEIIGNPAATIEVGEASFGNQTFGNENTQSSSTSSGSETGNK